MKNILIPTDFSSNAWNALQYALQLFKEEKCTFYLLNAFESVYFTTNSLMVPEPGEPAYDNAREASENGLQFIVEKIGEKSSLHKFKTISSYNTVIEAIKYILQENKIHFLVMGTEGKNSIENRIYGSTALAVMEKIKNCPILIIPHKVSYSSNGKKEIVFATDFKTSDTKKPVKYLTILARRFSAAVRVLYIQESEKLSKEQLRNKEMLQDHLKDISHSFHTLTKISTGAGIHSFIESRGSDLLAICRKKHGFFYRFFSRSVIEEIGYKPQIPILILPEFEG